MEKMREEFETWVLDYAEEKGYLYANRVVDKSVMGFYTTTWVDCAWIGWQAAWEAKEQNHG